MDHTQGVSLSSCQRMRRAIFAATDGRSVGFLVSQNLLLHFKAVQCRRSHWHLFELCLVMSVSINRVLCFIEGLLLPNCRGGRKPWHEARRSTKAFIGLHHQAPYLGSARVYGAINWPPVRQSEVNRLVLNIFIRICLYSSTDISDHVLFVLSVKRGWL